MFTDAMNLLELSVKQLKRAAAIKQRIEALNKELRGILGGSADSESVPKKKGTMSAAVKRKIAAAQRARWAKVRASKSSKPTERAKAARAQAGKAK
jgi:hypothetical protein